MKEEQERRAYAVLREIGAIVLGRKMENPLPLRWAKGMIGVIPVFESREDAEAFANKEYEIMEIITVKRK